MEFSVEVLDESEEGCLAAEARVVADGTMYITSLDCVPDPHELEQMRAAIDGGPQATLVLNEKLYANAWMKVTVGAGVVVVVLEHEGMMGGGVGLSTTTKPLDDCRESLLSFLREWARVYDDNADV